MEIREPVHSRDFCSYDTERIRKEFLIQKLFTPGQIKTVYSQIDRIIIGGACPREAMVLEAAEEIRARYFLERREMGIINIGARGTVTVDGVEYSLETRDGLYIGMGAERIVFTSVDSNRPAKFYFLSAPAHRTYPVVKIELKEVEGTHLGSLRDSNERTIYKYIHPQGVKSCQLVMGMTVLNPNNVWNTMPCHTHDRRMEVYLYFDLSQDMAVFHYMGQPLETRHIVVRNEEAVISPSWSIHSGVGTRNYAFIWGMVGENQAFDDMDGVEMSELK